ncbi:MAG: hypothetical protein JW751_28435 [Polyangiaceae bacterium]|nr:hypothetical protein [Polyangiaceae bacterium]
MRLTWQSGESLGARSLRIWGTFEQGTEAELLVLFEQLALDPLADSKSLPPAIFLSPNLKQLDIDVVPIVSDGDVVLQLLIINLDGGWYSFRAQAFRPLGGGQYCPLLYQPVSEEELVGEWSCHRETRNEHPWSWSFAPVLEANRNVIVIHDHADTYDGDWECPRGDIRRTQSFHTVEAGKLSPPLLILGSRTAWKRGDERIPAEWSESDTSFALEGDYPKRIVVTERRTECRGADRPGCPTPRESESVTVYGFDGHGSSAIPQGRR